MSIIRKFQNVQSYLTDFVSGRQDQLLYIELIQYLIFASIYLVAWISPSIFSPEFIITLQILIMFEFVMVHSGVFMSMGKNAVLIFFPFYFLFAWAFNQVLPDNTIMYLYLFTILNRLLLGFEVSVRKNDDPLVRSFYRGFVTYFPAFVGSILFSDLFPDFGLTVDVQRQIKEVVDFKSSGNITLKMLISCGFFYYLLLIFWELYLQKKNNESVNLLFISTNEIGAIVKSRLSTFSDYTFEVNHAEGLDLENFHANYSFVVKKETKYLKSISKELELIVITEDKAYGAIVKDYLKTNNLSHIPILDLSSVITPLVDEILLAYKQRVPEHFLEIPNKHHPIKRSITKGIFNEFIGPAIKFYLETNEFISTLNPDLQNRLINKLVKIDAY